MKGNWTNVFLCKSCFSTRFNQTDFNLTFPFLIKLTPQGRGGGQILNEKHNTWRFQEYYTMIVLLRHHMTQWAERAKNRKYI